MNKNNLVNIILKEDFKLENNNTNDYREIFSKKIKNLFLDQEITEIMINGLKNIFIEKNGKITSTDLKISNKEIECFIDFISQINNRDIGYNMPIFDGKLPDNSRCNIVIDPVAKSGPFITIRRHTQAIKYLEDLLERGSIKEKHLTFLENIIDNKKNIIIAGGTGTGKTTLVNAMVNSLKKLNRKNERIITIEDTLELRISLPHVLNLETKQSTAECPKSINIQELLKTSLRMRPDRIIIGEIRGAEAYDLLHATNTGHKGVISTIHSNSARDALRRLETLAILDKTNLNIDIPRTWISSNINTIIYLEKIKQHIKIAEIKQIEGIENGNYILENVF